MDGMMEELEARDGILGAVTPLPARRVALADALHYFAAESYRARLPLPAFDNSAMDGYAIGATDLAKGTRLRVTGEQRAGMDRHLRVTAGEAVRIFTGAPIPEGTEAVVMQEDVSREGDEVVVNTEVEKGEFIRRRACDLVEGQEILAVGQRIGPTMAALLASQGLAEVNVGSRAEVAILSTGDELVLPGETIEPGQIYNSNSILLSTLLRGMGAEVASTAHCSDEKGALAAGIREGAGRQVLVLTGGVSVGEHDLVQSVIRSLGGSIDIWRVAVKPGKPFLFGRIGSCAVFGLPGNPVSAFVTFLKFVRPAIAKMMGANAAELELPRVQARLAQELGNESDRAHYFRGRYQDGVFHPMGRQESHALYGLSRSNALARVPPGTRLPAGAILDLELWD